ncbi:hypothetical protein E1286_40480 [Nonomuraea terrae]|uniref:Uncharacterized protein n=1 Tax=Nonomuraea terrae TaxID=2530383 RepID=A0A4R4XT64_9ACTN|nr:hypothetical protein [Nonomuraea terrae]TDD34731.1 hypothetical protein E1286_40480 [Nonomuraea terrae]
MTAELERHYRRLLAAYPQEHRDRHVQEMIAVLLAGAEPGRRWPALRDAYDVVRGGLAIRLHRAADQGSRRHWREAADVAALIAPVLLFAAMMLRAAVYAWSAARPPVVPGELLQAAELAGYALPYGLVALLVWLGRARAATVSAWTFAILHGLESLRPPSLGASHVVTDGAILVMGEPVVLSRIGTAVLPMVLCAVMLHLAPSPGPAAVGSGRLLIWTAALLGAAVTGGMIGRGPVAVAPPLIVLLVMGVTLLRSPAGRRTLLVLSPLPAPIAGGLPGAGAVAQTLVIGLPAAAVLGVTGWLTRTGRVKESGE